MRLMRRTFISLAIVAFAASLAGCYTLLRHPDISGEYDLGDEQEQEPVVIAHCGECHSVARPLPAYVLPDEGNGVAGGAAPMRSIDPATPIRANGGGVGPVLPPATTTSGTSSASKTGDGAAEASSEKTKKDIPGGKTPVRRNAEDASKSSGDEKKTSDTKKERQ